MAAHRIRATNNNAIPRCKSEGTLIELSSGLSEAAFSDVQGPSPSTLRLEATASIESAREVIAIKDYCPSNFTTLKFHKGDHLYVLDTTAGEWWYAHNNTEMGYIPAAYVKPVTHRESISCDSGMIDSIGDISNDGSNVPEQRGEWSEHIKPTVPQNGNPFVKKRMSLNPFLEGSLLTDQSNIQSSSPDSKNSSSININKFGSKILDTDGTDKCPILRRNNPFYRSKRCYSLSELSMLQSRADTPLEFMGFFGSLKAPSPEQFQSREDFKSAWLNHRKFTRSCHDLDSIGQNPGWGQTQPIETNIVCKLDSSGGAVQLPDTDISILVPEGHVAPDETQQISLKALLDPPLELNSDKCTTVSPVVEIKLSNLETKTTLTLEMKVSVVVKMDSRQVTEVICVRSDCKDGPYVQVPNVYMYGDAVQVTLDNLEPCMYVTVVAQAQDLAPYNTVWEHVVKKVTLGLYGPKHIHPSFKMVVAMFGHDCAPKTLLVSKTRTQSQCIPAVSLQLWGKHQFVLAKPQDLKVGMYSNISNFEVKVNEQTRVVRSFQLKLGKVSRLIYLISARDPENISDFTLRIQVKDDRDCILAQFCVQTPPPLPKVTTSSVQRRFLKKKETHKNAMSPLIGVMKYPVFQDRTVKNIKFGKMLKTVLRQTKSQYLLEYVKGDVMALLSEEKIKLKGHLWTKEWYVGYYHGRIGLVHTKNILIMGKVKPVNFKGPELTSSVLLDQILIPCKCLTYMYSSLRTILTENINSWRAFADALGYVNLPLAHFSRTEPTSEPEKVACVLEKLKEDCNASDETQKKSFQKELFMALLKLDCQGLVARLLKDFALLTAAVEVAERWRELAEKLSKVSRKQMDSYEAPYRGTNGEAIESESMWKPAYDFLVTWAAQIGDSYRDVLQELHTGLDRMKNPITKRWRHLTGTLVLVNCLDLLRSTAFSTAPQDDCAV
ncbi:SH3 domain-binding protein 4 [Bagarius yarrelli]|uniref:SH3 domain-binding protein 4 n=1 Tax=Bagarius yarrelli TaxID=175774 RepID=A0A556U4H4_BAGYA|nr:SH3 domain-binding protein 4 [Bagarius yarrelli]